jgi:hypothetical protein
MAEVHTLPVPQCSKTRFTGMNEDGAIFVYLFQVYNELSRIMLCTGQNLCTEKCNDMIGNNISRLVCKIGIIHAKVGIEPFDLSWDKFAGNEAL